MNIDTDLIKKISKEAFLSLSILLVLTGFGAFFNFTLLFFLGPELSHLFNASGGMGHAGGAGAILAFALLAFINWQGSLLFISFFFIFPLLHFLISKKYLVSRAIFNILKEKKSRIVEFIFEKFFQKMNDQLDWLDKVNSSGIISAINQYLPVYLKKLEGMPFFIRGIVTFFLSRFDFLGMVSGSLNEEGKIDIGQKEIIKKITMKVDEVLDEKVFSPSFKGILILYLINIAIFIIIKVSI